MSLRSTQPIEKFKSIHVVEKQLLFLLHSLITITIPTIHISILLTITYNIEKPALHFLACKVCLSKKVYPLKVCTLPILKILPVVPSLLLEEYKGADFFLLPLLP